jgi:predicted RNase H-like HicB family nuclease
MIVLEQGPVGYGAYVPDLMGCIAVGETKEETLTLD